MRRLQWRIVHSGVGCERARTAALALLAAGAERLLVWGTAGALVPELRPGDLILPRVICDEAGRKYPVDPAWRAALRSHLPHPCTEIVRLVTVHAPVANITDKGDLAERSGAQAVDMEATAVAAVAIEHKVPFVVLRTIADPLELNLPFSVLTARGDRLLALEIPLRTLFRPRDLPALYALARAFGPARRNLVRAAEQLAGAPS